MTNPRRKREFLRKNGVEIELYIDGEGPAFVILPSYGRGISADFDAITARVVEAGWTVLRPQPRGIAGSKGPMTNLTMHDLANDVAFSIRSVSGGPAVLLGHAFGNMLARMVTTDHPDLVTAVVQCVFFGMPPQTEAAPISRRTGSTWSFVLNMRFVSGRVAPSTSSAARTFFWLSGSQLGTSKLPGLCWPTLIASCRL